MSEINHTGQPADPTEPEGITPRPAPLEPVRRVERVGAVDVLRGFALLGILVINVYAFGLPVPAYLNPFKGGGQGPLDIGTWWTSHLFFEMKFMTIFSMLFGAGLVLMAERAEARGGRFGPTYYRRLFWLLVIGLVHGYLLWFGDILFWYAACGMILYPMRRLRATTLLVVGMALVSVVVLIMLGFGFFALPQMKADAEDARSALEAGETLTEEQEAALEQWAFMDADEDQLAEEIEAYRGSYLDQFLFRAPVTFRFQIVFLFLFGWRISGTMLIGMALMKMGVFAAARSNRFYGLCCLLGYGSGLPLILLGARRLLEESFDPIYFGQIGIYPNYFGSLAVAMGHVGLVMLVFRAGLLGGLMRRLGSVGRMALSNYLTHTILCTTIFYGWGLGLFGHLGRFQMMGIVVGVWILQLITSPIWLARYRFGPAEWMWRSLTYGKAQRMRGEPRAGTS